MRLGRLTWLVVVGALLALPMTASAQDGTLSGTVLDNTGGVLPGPTITAQNEATGNTFLAVTDETGAFRVPVRIGIYTITVEFPGMQGQAQSGVRVLVGQEVAMGAIELAVSTIQETITVTGEAPLLDVTSSDISGNIVSRQIEDLPLNGRNWLDLSLLAPGSRDNASTSVPQGRQGQHSDSEVSACTWLEELPGRSRAKPGRSPAC